ncbi:hypothetical protein P3X46_005183 [Hevea brasiliensis]|uniref:Uncharacterized protein n=1 Tax=Hevea brasiliensis TaxID=3981 RepID=A0ABQ9N0W7_HEVBR|nr:uncharacterized protein LOC110653598 isoform X2 [Hevea brasiliensis]KAJ9185565.1 hypothetical protein P3X46_005183 [Hevea brasiliensis]
MDFHSLARKELQALCKKNKIPANMTNVAMADALKALEKVEGLDELNNEPRSNPQESPERTTNAEPRTACRTSTRRKPINVEPESSQPVTRTRRATRRTVAEEAEQENKNVNLLETPAMLTTRRRAPAASAPRKMDAQLMELGEDEKLVGQEKSDVPETPATRTSQRKAPAVSTRRKTEAQKDEKSVQRVYGTRKSVRLLEKSMADLSLKEKWRVEAVKIEGLCEKTEEVEQKNDMPGGDSQFLSCQNIDVSLENENEMLHGVQEDNNSNDQEGDSSEVLSLGNLEHSLGNESEMKHEFQEDNKTNDHEIDNSVVSFQKLDQPLENGSEMKNEPNEHNNNADHEVYSEVLCQNIDQLHKSESETKLKHQEDKRGNDHEVVDCNAEIEIGSESCTNLDNDSGLGEDDEDNCESSDESFFQQVETSEVDMNCESMDEKGSHVVITENSETLNAALKPEIEELNGNQDSMIVEVSDDSSAFVMETIVNVPDEVSVEVMDSLIPEVSEAEGKSSEINLMEDEQHGSDDPHSDPATEKDSDGNAIEELPDGSRSDEVQENDNAAKIQEKAPFLPQVEYEKSESRKDEPESPRFILQHEKCKEASDNLSNEYNIDDVIVIEAKESDIHDQKSPFCCPPVSDSEIAGDQVTGGMVISPPFAANTIQGQFPRPTESTPSKSSTKKLAIIQKIIYADFNKENIDNSGRKVEPNKEKVKKKIVEEEKKYEDFSVRQLTKMLKEKLEIANQKNGGVSKVGTRPALQVLTENCKAAGEPENKN